MSILQSLLEKAKKSHLGHFYILETSAPSDTADEILLSFTHQFIKEYYHQVEGQKLQMVHLMDHPDVFVLGNTGREDEEVEDKAFTVLESESLGRFFEFKPVQSQKKFAVITQAHRINPIVANKWLKLFEEPLGNTTIFLLNPRRQKLLPTIHSRAIHLRLSAQLGVQDFTEWNDFINQVKTMSLASFLETFTKGDRDLSFWVNELIKWEAEQSDQIAPKENLAKWLKIYQEQEIFHQPPATKWTLFYSHLKDNVLSRLIH